jgi:hypothetical protein
VPTKAGAAKTRTATRKTPAEKTGDGATGSSAATKPAKAKGSDKPQSAPARGKPTRASSATERLQAGGLEPLVLDFLAKHKDDAPHGPTQVAKALGRSSGAVSNCLVRLTNWPSAERVLLG